MLIVAEQVRTLGQKVRATQGRKLGGDELEYVTGNTAGVAWVAVGDLDGDSRNGLVFSGLENRVSVLLNPCP